MEYAEPVLLDVRDLISGSTETKGSVRYYRLTDDFFRGMRNELMEEKLRLQIKISI